MIFFPNCKINLGLNIVSKRPDGYHDLETVFYPIQIKDAIEVIENKEPGFSISGSLVEGEPKDNLCFKAHQLLKKDFPNLPAVQIHLHKMIPIGAGLGGGSSDAAFMLKLLNKKFGLSLSETQLQSYALQLGSDCPFFIVNKPCFATGRGEKLEHMDLDLGAYKFLIVYPGIHVNTSQAFSNIRPATPGRSVKEIVQQPIQSWKNELKNDFEGSVFNQYKEIKTIKEEMYEAGATYASMSGSGSAVYGIFKKDQKINSSFPADYFVKELDS